MRVRVESFQNPRIKAAAALRKSEERRRTGRIIIDGLREIRRAREAGVVIEQLFYCPSLAPSEAAAFAQELETEGVTIIEVPARLFEKIAFGEREEGLVAIAQSPSHTLKDLTPSPGSEPPLLVAIEGLEKPGNLGAIIRSADGAGATGVIAADLRCDLYNPAAIRASLGTIFGLPVATADARRTLEFLRDNKYCIVAARVDGAVPYYDIDLAGPTAIILGSEAHGLTEIWRADDVVAATIPMHGRADSLNVSVAAAILLFEARRQRSVAREKLRNSGVITARETAH